MNVPYDDAAYFMGTESFEWRFDGRQWGVFMKYRSPGYWIAGVIFWGLTSVALAEGAGTTAAKEPVVRSGASAHHDVHHAAARPPQHSPRAPTKHVASAKASSTPPAQNDNATAGQYQFSSTISSGPPSVRPDVGFPRYSGSATGSSVLTQNSTRNASPPTTASQSSATAPDDNWTFKASPILNATHSHEIGASVSFRHDF
ncbi:hypothetical protein [Paraburkholderia rhizosphaerae]|uniref:hypothetical protein n=1 Tax=Paraburkholderia rhizosphaerae TaxID=480658 RepID=UPI0010647253|nr:hypothetical protein [Paraburkholderia rhizosphaerae]